MWTLAGKEEREVLCHHNTIDECVIGDGTPAEAVPVSAGISEPVWAMAFLVAWDVDIKGLELCPGVLEWRIRTRHRVFSLLDCDGIGEVLMGVVEECQFLDIFHVQL